MNNGDDVSRPGKVGPTLHLQRFWRGCIGISRYTAVVHGVEWTVEHDHGVWTAQRTVVPPYDKYDPRCLIALSRRAIVAQLAAVEP